MKHKKFLSILTRCRDEFYIKEWCDYYTSQGVDDIYIIDDDSNDRTIYDFTTTQQYNHVHVTYVDRMYGKTTTKQQAKRPRHDDTPNTLYNQIKNMYKWFIYCDVDEFITTKKNFNITIREQLIKIDDAHDNKIDSIAVPWVFMSGSKLTNNPSSILQEVVYRHDHDKRHPHPIKKFRCRFEGIEFKLIFKPAPDDLLQDHGPVDRIVWNSIDLTRSRVKDGRILNLRNNDIDNGVFLCYHYRYISDEHCLNKLKTNGWYINDGYTFEDMKTSSYAEIYDDTMLKKTNGLHNL